MREHKLMSRPSGDRSSSFSFLLVVATNMFIRNLDSLPLVCLVLLLGASVVSANQAGDRERDYCSLSNQKKIQVCVPLTVSEGTS